MATTSSGSSTNRFGNHHHHGSSSSSDHNNNNNNNTQNVLLCTVLMVFLLNVDQMCRFEFGRVVLPSTRRFFFQTTTTANNASTNDDKDKNSPSYFRRPGQQRQYKKPLPGRIENGTRPVRDFVKKGDYVYYRQNGKDGNGGGSSWGWDTSPIVVEKYRLVFFTIQKVGCTVWKQLFRRMTGYDDWTSQDGTTYLPHNPEVNGLKYLWDYSLEDASAMMTSPNWTRAVMVRDPKERFLSAFLDKAVGNFHSHIINRCCRDGSCVEGAQTISGFLKLCQKCQDGHWRPQHDRMEPKYWPYVDEVLHVESAADGAERLLRRIGAWEEFGASGWGPYGNQSIFQSKGTVGGAGTHATWAQWQAWKWYTPETEARVEGFYQSDYENPLFNFTRGVCLTCPPAGGTRQ